MTFYYIRDEEKKEFGRQSLTLWSGAFASDYEGHAVELPRHDGFLVNLEYKDSVRVTCPAPRNETNYQEVDAAINAALNVPEPAVPVPTPYDTGDRLEPKPWHVQSINLPDPEEVDRYGRVDFDNDEGFTAVTAYVERTPEGYVLHVTDNTDNLTVNVNK